MISIHSLEVQYDNKTVLNNISLDVEDSTIVSILGPSGCGKSTLLKTVVGLIQPSSGVVTVDGQVINKINRDSILLPQEGGLFPWLSVIKNIEFVLIDRGMDKRKATTIALQSLERIGMLEYKDRYPNSLSGGQRQRCSLAKVLALKPNILLLDEPTASLDFLNAQTVIETIIELKKLYPVTILFVTHNIEEACLIGDKLVVMNDGKIIAELIPKEYQDMQRNHELLDTIKEFYYEKNTPY